MNEEEIERGEEEASKNSTKYLVYTVIFIVFLTALFFSIKYFYHPEPKVETYVSASNYEFSHLAGLWNTEWKRGNSIYSLHFHYNPGQTENISIVGNFEDTSFNKGYVYITFDPEGEDLEYVRLGFLELSLNLVNALNVEPRIACTKENPACEKVLKLNCSSSTEPMIQLTSKEGTFIGLNKNCIYVHGKKEELIRASDRLLFQWFGIM